MFIIKRIIGDTKRILTVTQKCQIMPKQNFFGGQETSKDFH